MDYNTKLKLQGFDMVNKPTLKMEYTRFHFILHEKELSVHNTMT